MPCHAGPHGEAPGLIMKQKEQGKHDLDLYYYVFCGKGKAGNGNGLELASLNNVFGH